MSSRDDLRDFVQEAAERHLVPGAAVGVIHGDDQHVATVGVTSVVDPLPIDDRTLFHIGSTSKTFTATAAMSLVEQGLLDLDAPLVHYLPELRLADPAARDSVKVRDLFTHTAGWPGDDLADTGWGDDAVARVVVEQLPHLPQLVAPGLHPSYNNLSATVAAHLMETVTGKTFEDVVRERVLDPLHLADTFSFPHDVAHRRHAVGHVVAGGVARPVPQWQTVRAMVAAGGLVSSLGDQLAYARFQLDGSAAGRAPVSASTRLFMQRPHVRVNDWFGVGISWLVRSRGDLTVVAHGGNIAGLYVSAFALVPRERFGVVVLTNAATGGPFQDEVLSWALERYLGHVAPVLKPEPVAAASMADYEGRYATGELDIEVARHGELMAVTTRYVGEVVDPAVAIELEKPTQVFFVAPEVVAAAPAPHQPVGEFVRDDDGSVGWLRWGMRLVRRQDPDAAGGGHDSGKGV